MEVVTRAFVLAMTPYKERDVVVELITEEMGFCVAMARGLKTSKKRYGYSLDYFNLIRISLTRKRPEGMWTLAWAEFIREFVVPRSGLEGNAAGMMLLTAIRSGSKIADPGNCGFEAVLKTLQHLESKGESPWFYAVKGILEFYECLGFSLRDTVCSQCGKKLDVAVGIDPDARPLCEECCSPGECTRFSTHFIDLLGDQKGRVEEREVADLQEFLSAILERQLDLLRFYRLAG